MSESIPMRIERIMHEQNMSFHEAFRVAMASSRVEREVARRKPVKEPTK